VTEATGRIDGISERSTANRGVGPARDRYDLLLALIPLAFLVAVLAVHVLPVTLRQALGAASVVCLLGIVDGVYRNPPVEDA